MPNSTITVADLNGTNGFAITGVNANDYVGYSIGSGDINGDGIADLLLGVPYGNSRYGAAYVVYGSGTPFPATLSVSSLNGANGFTVAGANVNDNAGFSIGSGDINGDGIADLLLGAIGVNSNAVPASGAAYVVYGSRTPFPATLNVGSLNGANGFVVTGVTAYDQVGRSVGSGDINGDGIADLLLGAPAVNSNTGVVYAVYGSHSPFPASFNVSSLNGTNGFAVTGVIAYDQVGVSIGSGDLNGDGVADLLLGANGVNATAGAAYAVYGSRSPFPVNFSVSSLDGTNGFTVTGVNANDYVGQSIGSGDLNGDGIADLLLGANGVNSNAGAAYVMYGSHTPFPATMGLSDLNGTNGFAVIGVNSYDYAGWSIGSGDINGDGVADLLFGAKGVNSLTGAAYAVYSRSVLPPLISLSGSIGPRLSSSTPQQSGAIPLQSSATPQQSGAIPLQSSATPQQSGAIPLQSSATPQQSGTTPQYSGTTPQPSEHVVVNSASQHHSFLSPITDALATGLKWLGFGRQTPVANTRWALADTQTQEEQAPSARVRVNPPAFEQALVGNLALFAVLKEVLSPAKAQGSQSTWQAQLVKEAKQFGEHPYGKLYYQELAQLDIDFMDEQSIKAAVAQLSQNTQQRLLDLLRVDAVQRMALLAELPKDLQGVLESWSEAINTSAGHDKQLIKAAEAKTVAWQAQPAMTQLGFFATAQRPISPLANHKAVMAFAASASNNIPMV